MKKVQQSLSSGGLREPQFGGLWVFIWLCHCFLESFNLVSRPFFVFYLDKNNVKEGKEGNLRVVSYTEEVDPMLHDLEYDGEVINKDLFFD